MDCAYFEKIIYRLPDDDLTLAEREELAAHVAECADCRTLYDAMAAARESLTERVSVPEGFAAKVMKAVHTEEKSMKTEAAANARKANVRKHWRFGDFGLIAACLAMVVVVLNVVYGDLGRRDTTESAAEAAPMMLEEAATEAESTAAGAAPEALEPMEAADMAAEAAMDGGVENGAKAANSAPAGIPVMDESGALIGTLDTDTLAALLTDADGSTAGTDAPPTWTVEADGAVYELFVMDEVLFWRAQGEDTLTRSELDAQSFTAILG